MKKLRHALYSVLNAGDVDSADYRIADFLVRNLYKVEHFGIQDVADACFVSKSTVSRFCRRIGFPDFMVLSQSMRDFTMRNYRRFDEYLSLEGQEAIDRYLSHAQECMMQVRAAATPEVVDEFARLLDRYDSIGVFGQMQSYAVALNLQFELASLGKYVSCYAMMPDQEEFVMGSGRDTLAIVVSSGGRYFQDFSANVGYLTKDRPYLVLVTNNRRLARCVPYDKVYVVPCANNTASRPFSLQVFTNLAVMRLSKIIEDRLVLGDAADSEECSAV